MLGDRFVSVAQVLLTTMLSFTFLLLKKHCTGATFCECFFLFMWDRRACSPKSDKLQVVLHSVHPVLLLCFTRAIQEEKSGCFVQHNLEKSLFCNHLIILILFTDRGYQRQN